MSNRGALYGRASASDPRVLLPREDESSGSPVPSRRFGLLDYLAIVSLSAGIAGIIWMLVR
jgi:hypothetical protein